jgi:hypothetical protein
MPAPLLMIVASLLFATMGVCVKLASELYAAGEIVFYRKSVFPPQREDDIRTFGLSQGPRLATLVLTHPATRYPVGLRGLPTRYNPSTG